MPFEQIIPRAFTYNSLGMYAPMAAGVYGISNAREWIYIGVADNIQNALMAHLAASDSNVMGRTPTGFVFEVCERGNSLARQYRLIHEYGPVCHARSSVST